MHILPFTFCSFIKNHQVSRFYRNSLPGLDTYGTFFVKIIIFAKFDVFFDDFSMKTDIFLEISEISSQKCQKQAFLQVTF